MSESDRRSALRCIEELLETGITDSQLLQAADVLTASQYSDVVEERTIEHLCGYPLCDQQLVNVPKQRYHISTATNQVLDLTQRKKFCSSRCFKASNYFSSQLSTLPPAARTSKRPMQLLPSPDSSLCESVTETSLSHRVQQESTSVNVQSIDPTESVVEKLQSHLSLEHTATDHTQSTSSHPSPPTPSKRTESTSSHQSQPSPSDHTRSPHPHSTPTCQTQQYPLEEAQPQVSSETKVSGKLTNKYMQRIMDSLDIWLGSTDTANFDPGQEVFQPPLHDVCVPQVQRSIFLGQIRSTLKSIGGDVGVGVIEMASTFRLTNTCVTFRPPQWMIIVTLLVAICHGEVSLKCDILESSLKELRATRDDFNSLLAKAKQLAGQHTTDTN